MRIETAAFGIGDWKSDGRRKAHKDKNPRVNYHPGMPFFIPIAKLPIHEERDSFQVRAGLPASGSLSGRPSHH